MRERIQEHLMFIDINDKETKDLTEKVYAQDETWKGKERLVLPVFGLYVKLIGDGNGDKQITTFAYEIRTNPKSAQILKNILSEVAIEEASKLKFISYGLNSIGNKNTMKNTILQKHDDRPNLWRYTQRILGSGISFFLCITRKLSEQYGMPSSQ